MEQSKRRMTSCINPFCVDGQDGLRDVRIQLIDQRRILHAPNLIAELSACKMRRLNQLNATYFN